MSKTFEARLQVSFKGGYRGLAPFQEEMSKWRPTTKPEDLMLMPFKLNLPRPYLGPHKYMQNHSFLKVWGYSFTYFTYC